MLSVQLVLALAALVCWIFSFAKPEPRVPLHIPVLLLIVICLLGLLPR
jgi:hypothetical protein